MNKSAILEKNLSALSIKSTRIIDGVLRYMEDNTLNGVYIEESADCNKIAAIEYKNRTWYLNSRYKPGAAAQIWADQHHNKNNRTLFIIFGLANGMYLEALLNTITKDNFVLVWEPNPSLFCKVISEIDLSNALMDERVFVSVEHICDFVGLEVINLLINYSNLRLIDYTPLPNYDILYKEQWKNVVELIKSRMEILILDRNTQISFSSEFIRNMIKNYKDMINQYTVNQLKDQIREMHLDHVPAILVAAGPSLDKNIMDIKAVERKAFIIVADTALKPVLRAGIEPDVVITVDPHKPLELFDHEKFNDIPMVVCQYTNFKVNNLHKGKRFYFDDGESYIGSIYEKILNYTMIPLESGGSVANNAFSLAMCLGFKTIILVGQDLAYTDHKFHTSSAYDKRKNSYTDDEYEIHKKNIWKDMIEIEDINGNMVRTKKNMELYLRWFERQIVRYPNIKVIDATEGGAKKKGTEIMKLKDAIERECNHEYDFKERINSIPKAFDEDQYRAVTELFNNIPFELDEMNKKIEHGIRDYYKLEELVRKGKSNTSEFKKITEKIEEINILIEHEPIMELASMYNRQTDFEVQENIYAYKENIMDEIREITDRGIKMLTSYKSAIEKMRKDIIVLVNE